ncbi:MAG: lipoyl synthase [Candidatus Marinimicrobia bacterium]|jgi:lipoic acid synthetase|nr:lipoyl synthase [Candidatus Neomarinimicrobiota bacterium]MBT3630103.1 lipoyl synthase [Candidatus Neomarinimicrobiota bacterium]MBT3826055.1 lipoyl synthase [Candidatus Neomarinimicrobiota bacterium]MBT4132089.1 lipoyl synthase [Candidatus Neomarinimicrobiota bacterium]MBT4296576.1 lipoyl synthase [Candidatus Neomarinimicrobiota bacterium]
MKTKTKPAWLKTKLRSGPNFQDLKSIVSSNQVHTVCQEAMCPNISECWERRAATIMILGDTCTRSCGFCAVKTGRPSAVDLDEPRRTAEAVKKMGLHHCVITSVDRDELDDDGAAIWAETIRQIHTEVPGCSIEVLTPDFQGNPESIKTVLDAKPEIMSHNMETVERLHRRIRPQAQYQRSLDVLRQSVAEGLQTKTSIMVGIGEAKEEVFALMDAVRATGCQIFSLGQYLQPTKAHEPVHRYVHPDEFEEYKVYGLKIGFNYVESGPLVRSSYHADEQVLKNKILHPVES